jgi:hypothetical protein
MARIVKVFSICLSILLALPLTGWATASPLAQDQQEGYTLSGEALAAAKRFRSKPNGRLFADLEVVLKEFLTAAGTASAAGQDQYQAISQQQLLDLLGPPPFEGEKGQVTYGHSYGTTSFFFEGGRLKNFLTLGEGTVWYEPTYPRQSAAKRFWHKMVKWSRKLKRLLL